MVAAAVAAAGIAVLSC